MDNGQSPSAQTELPFSYTIGYQLTIIARRKFKSLKLFVWIVSFSVRLFFLGEKKKRSTHSHRQRKEPLNWTHHQKSRRRVDNRVKEGLRVSSRIAPNQTAQQEGSCSLCRRVREGTVGRWSTKTVCLLPENRFIVDPIRHMSSIFLSVLFYLHIWSQWNKKSHAQPDCVMTGRCYNERNSNHTPVRTLRSFKNGANRSSARHPADEEKKNVNND